MGEKVVGLTPYSDIPAQSFAAGIRELARKVTREEIELHELSKLPNRSMPLPAASWPNVAPVLALAPTRESIYISGPMRGYPDMNAKAFDAAERYFLGRGYDVYNPSRMDSEIALQDEQPGRAFYARRDLEAVIRADKIALLRGWEASKGAMAEAYLAQWMEKEAYYQRPPVFGATDCLDFDGPELIRLTVCF